MHTSTALAIALLTLSTSEIETLNKGLKVTEYVHDNMLESRIEQEQIIMNEYNETGYLEERIRLVVTIKRVMRIIDKLVEKRCNIY